MGKLIRRKSKPTLQAQAADPFKHLMGWDHSRAIQARKKLGKTLRYFSIQDPSKDYHGQRRMLWEYTRKVLGQDTPNYAQEIGDCVSFGGKNVLEHLSAVEIALNSEAEKWHAIFPPYFYGISRIQIGGGQLGNGDGSVGVWLQEGAKKYGVLAADEAGVPPYSGQVAKQWGRNGPDAQFIPTGQKHLVKTTALVRTSEEAANALLNGYPCNICSNQGFQMEPSSDGFHAPRGSWGHCMTLIGFEDHPQNGLYFIILNSWGDVHGRLKDFSSDAQLPVGVLRVKSATVDRMLAMEDSFAFSQYDGYPDQSGVLDKALFDLVGE